MEHIRLIHAWDRGESLPNDETRLCVPIRQSFEAKSRQAAFAHAIMPAHYGGGICYTGAGLALLRFRWRSFETTRFVEKVRIHADELTCVISRNGDGEFNPGIQLAVIDNTADPTDPQKFRTTGTVMRLLCKDTASENEDNILDVGDIQCLTVVWSTQEHDIPSQEDMKDLSTVDDVFFLSENMPAELDNPSGMRMMQIFDVAVFNKHIYCLCGTSTPGKRVCVVLAFSEAPTPGYMAKAVFDVKMDYADIFRIISMAGPNFNAIVARSRNPAFRVIEYDTGSATVQTSRMVYGNKRMTFPVSAPLYDGHGTELLQNFDRIVDVAASSDGYFVACRNGSIFYLPYTVQDVPVIFPQLCGRLDSPLLYVEHEGFEFDTGFFHRDQSESCCIGTWRSIRLEFLSAPVTPAVDACKNPVVPVERPYIGPAINTKQIDRKGVETMLSYLAYQENVRYSDLSVKQFFQAMAAADFVDLYTAVLHLRKKMFLQFRHKGISRKEQTFLQSLLLPEAHTTPEVFMALVALFTSLKNIQLSPEDLSIISRQKKIENAVYSRRMNQDVTRDYQPIERSFKTLKMPISALDTDRIWQGHHVVFVDCEPKTFKTKMKALDDTREYIKSSELGQMRTINDQVGAICAIVPTLLVNSLLRGLDVRAESKWKLTQTKFGYVACSYMLSAASLNMFESPIFRLFDMTCYVKPIPVMDDANKTTSLQDLTSAIALFLWMGFETVVEQASLLGMQLLLVFGQHPQTLIDQAAIEIRDVMQLIKDFVEGTKTLEEILPVYHLAILLHAMSKMTHRFGAISTKAPSGNLPVLDEKSQALVNTVGPLSLPGIEKCTKVLNSIKNYVPTTTSGSKRQRTLGQPPVML